MALTNTSYVDVDVLVGKMGHTRTVKRLQGTCPCGAVIVIEYDEGYGWDCDCGRIYNLNGQELRPRSEWEEPMEEDE